MGKVLNILIVEDVPRDAEAIQEELRSEGIAFVARRVETRAGLLSELQKSVPDIVLSDFTLPEFNALDALRLLQEQRSDVPFILVTGTRSEEVAVECIKEGADDYILKASLKRLPSSILNVLKKKAAEREKARAEDALRRSEEQYRLIAENTRDLISLLDLNGQFLYASPSFQPGLGYRPDELTFTDSFALVHPEDRAIFRAAWQQALTTREGQSVEFRAINAQREWRTFEAVTNWIFDKHGQPQRSVTVARDITERKKAEETLRDLPRLILDAQEVERRRVARDLHDSVNQILSSVKFRIQAVAERLLEGDNAAGHDAHKAKVLLEKAIQEVRDISRNLRPSELDDLGLIPAARSLCDEFTERTKIPVRFSCPRVPPSLVKEVELHVYRILQEALNNIGKHARATQVDISLLRDATSLVVTVCDNGRGYDQTLTAARRARKPGMGIVDMTERAHVIGGSFQIESAPGDGTTLSIRIPLPVHEHVKTKSAEKRKKEKNQAPAGR